MFQGVYTELLSSTATLAAHRVVDAVWIMSANSLSPSLTPVQSTQVKAQSVPWQPGGTLSSTSANAVCVMSSF